LRRACIASKCSISRRQPWIQPVRKKLV
jgi:hypothetical protein